MRIKYLRLLLIILITTFLLSCNKKEDKKEEDKKTSNEEKKDTDSTPDTDKYAFFETEKAKYQSRIENQIVYGKVKASNNYSIVAMNQGKISHLFLKNGDLVKKGQKLAHIENKINNSELEQLKVEEENNLSEIQRTKKAFDSAKKLFDIGVMPKQDYDTAFFNYEQAKIKAKESSAKIKTQETQLNYNEIYAENSGYITNLLPKGSLVGNGIILGNIVTDPSNIDFVIPFSIKIKSGENLYIENKSYKIKSIFTDSTGNNKIANIELKNKTFESGENIKGILKNTIYGIKVPITSVVTYQEKPTVFVVKHDKDDCYVKAINITIKYADDNNYLLAGIKNNEEIITKGAEILEDKEKISCKK